MAEQKTPITLNIDAISLEHVLTQTGKVVAISLKLEDSKPLEGLLNDSPLPVRKMMITDVNPIDGTDDVEVLFRHLGPSELGSVTAILLNPHMEDTNSVQEVTQAILAALAGEATTAVLGRSGAAVEEEHTHHAEGEEDVNDTLGRIGKDIHNAQMLWKQEQRPDKQIYRIVLPLTYAHLGQTLCAETAGPAFILTSDEFPFPEDRDMEWEDSIAFLEFPDRSSKEYFEATNLLGQAVTGAVQSSVDISHAHLISANLLSAIFGLVAGDKRSLDMSFETILPLNRSLIKAQRRIKMQYEDALSLYEQTSVDNLFLVTHPHTMNVFMGGVPAVHHSKETAALEEMFQDSNLGNAFDEIMAEAYAENGFRLQDNPTMEEAMGFYSTPLSRATLPPGMKSLAAEANFDFLFTRDWMNDDPSELSDAIKNKGVVNLAKLLTVAVRVARMKEISEKGVPILTLALLAQGLTLPEEHKQGQLFSWLLPQATRMLREQHHTNFFSRLLHETLPPLNEDEDRAERLAVSPLAAMLHMFLHRVGEDDWDIGLVSSQMSDAPLIQDILQNFSLRLATDPEDGGEDEQKVVHRAAMMTIMEMLPQQDVQSLCVQMGTALLTLAKLHVMKTTQFTEGSVEWEKHMDGYLSAVASFG